MSNVKTGAIVEYKRGQAKQNIMSVMSVLRTSGKPLSTREIEKRMTEIVRGLQKKRIESVYGFEQDEPSQPGIRTIQRVLERLLKDGLVQKRDGRYSLTEEGLGIKHWSHYLGMGTLSAGAGVFYPTVNSIGPNIDNLITLFGTYIVFCFMEISRPGISKTNETPLDLAERDNLTREAIKNLLDPEQMYRMFLATIKSQRTNEAIEKTLKERFQVLENGKIAHIDNYGKRNSPPSIKDLEFAEIAHECSTNSDYRRTGVAIKELPIGVIDTIERILKKRFPILFEAMHNVKLDLGPIERELNL